jgi:hypothetical protein
MKFDNRTMKKLLFFSCMIYQLQALPNTHVQSDPINPKYPVKTVIKEATTQASPKKKKALVAVFGVFSRSLRKTWPQINRMIVKPLEKDYDVEIYGFNNQVDNIDTLDSMPIQKSGVDTIKTNHKLVYQEIKQSQLDEYIKQDNSWLTHSWTPKYPTEAYYSQTTRINAIRQFYQEQHVSDYIFHSNKEHDLVIALIADMYPLVPLSIDDSIADNNIFMPSEYCNGFYLGNKQSVVKTMSTVSTLDNLEQREQSLEKFRNDDYESLQVHSIRSNKIKIRAKMKKNVNWMLFSKRRNSSRSVYRTDQLSTKNMKWSSWLAYHYELSFTLSYLRITQLIVSTILIALCSGILYTTIRRVYKMIINPLFSTIRRACE